MATSEVLVGGRDPDEIYNQRAQEVRDQQAREVQEQRAREQRATAGVAGGKDPVLPGEVSASGTIGSSKKKIVSGRFNAGYIEEHPEGFLFRDVELPIGNYEQILVYHTLWHDPHAPPESNDLKHDVHYWGSHNETFIPTRIMPAWLRYALQTICYLKRRDETQKDAAEAIRSRIWKPDADEGVHNATLIEYRGYKQAVITQGVGWPADHAFYNQFEADIAGDTHVFNKEDNARLPMRETITPFLEAICYENDAGRAADVLCWIVEYDAHCGFIRRRGRDDNFNSGDCGVTFYNNKLSDVKGQIIADQTSQERRRARAVHALSKKVTWPGGAIP